MTQRRKRWLILFASLLLAPLLLHAGVTLGTRMTPPQVSPQAHQLIASEDDPTLRTYGPSYARKRGAIHEVRLVGNPATLGHAHTTLLYEEQVAIEREVHAQFTHFVPLWLARVLLVDLSRLRFSHLDKQLLPERRQEIAAQALAFDPDPFSSLMPTYQRFVFLQSLYDIMLSFERSPLIGCTSFVLHSEVTANGHTLVGRNFDFEGPQVLDDHKAVFLMLEDGRVPYASIAWPGFVGTTSGMNAEGVAVVIHGARAGEPQSEGEPVAHTVRDILGLTHNTAQAVALLQSRKAMVSHMLLITDAAGNSVIIERIPGRAPHVRPAKGAVAALTNHLEGPGAVDPKNHEVLKKSSTTARRQRLDELLSGLRQAKPADAIAVLRDKSAAGGKLLPMGHRDAIDALIATHSVVMDTTAKIIWVNEGPHATGRYVRFDLQKLLAPDYEPAHVGPVKILPADDVAGNGSYKAWTLSGSPHPEAK